MTAWLVEPESVPAATVVVPDEKSEVVLYSNTTVVLDPFGFTVPLKVADPLDAVPLSVVASGASALAVVNDLIVPVLVPLEFVAEIR